jgi:hypothetical protein
MQLGSVRTLYLLLSSDSTFDIYTTLRNNVITTGFEARAFLRIMGEHRRDENFKFVWMVESRLHPDADAAA